MNGPGTNRATHGHPIFCGVWNRFRTLRPASVWLPAHRRRCLSLPTIVFWPGDRLPSTLPKNHQDTCFARQSVASPGTSRDRQGSLGKSLASSNSKRQLGTRVYTPRNSIPGRFYYLDLQLRVGFRPIEKKDPRKPADGITQHGRRRQGTEQVGHHSRRNIVNDVEEPGRHRRGRQSASRPGRPSLPVSIRHSGKDVVSLVLSALFCVFAQQSWCVSSAEIPPASRMGIYPSAIVSIH